MTGSNDLGRATLGVADHVTWSTLGWRARTWRLIHAAWSIVGLVTLAHIWVSALLRRRDRALAASAAFLLIEGGALVVGRGDCPMGRVQSAWGDPVPFFELVLPPRAAKAAVPVLAVATILGMVAVAARPLAPCDRAPGSASFTEWGGLWGSNP